MQQMSLLYSDCSDSMMLQLVQIALCSSTTRSVIIDEAHALLAFALTICSMLTALCCLRIGMLKHPDVLEYQFRGHTEPAMYIQMLTVEVGITAGRPLVGISNRTSSGMYSNAGQPGLACQSCAALSWYYTRIRCRILSDMSCCSKTKLTPKL